MPTTAQAIEKTPFKPLPKQLSIIVPTYKEVLNIPVLTRRIFEGMLFYHMIFLS